jgi:hypothetical protein
MLELEIAGPDAHQQPRVGDDENRLFSAVEGSQTPVARAP